MRFLYEDFSAIKWNFYMRISWLFILLIYMRFIQYCSLINITHSYILLTHIRFLYKNSSTINQIRFLYEDSRIINIAHSYEIFIWEFFDYQYCSLIWEFYMRISQLSIRWNFYMRILRLSILLIYIRSLYENSSIINIAHLYEIFI